MVMFGHAKVNDVIIYMCYVIQFSVTKRCQILEI